MQWMNGLGTRLRIPISTEHVMNVEDDTCDDVQPRSNPEETHCYGATVCRKSYSYI